MLDKIGRKIGHNWWRELIVSSWILADVVWQQAKDAVANGYSTEDEEFAHQNPRPTLKTFMIGFARQEGEDNG